MGKADQQQETEKNALLEKYCAYQGKIFSVFTETLKNENKLLRTWDTVVHPGAVGILPIDDKGDLVLIKQWRRSVQQVLIEISAGTLEKNETPLECAKRELEEETGLKATNWSPLGQFYSSPGYCSEILHLFLAFGLEQRTAAPCEDESIDIFKISLEKALEGIQNNTICDAKTIIAILRCKEKMFTSE